MPVAELVALHHCLPAEALVGYVAAADFAGVAVAGVFVPAVDWPDVAYGHYLVDPAEVSAPVAAEAFAPVAAAWFAEAFELVPVEAFVVVAGFGDVVAGAFVPVPAVPAVVFDPVVAAWIVVQVWVGCLASVEDHLSGPYPDGASFFLLSRGCAN